MSDELRPDAPECDECGLPMLYEDERLGRMGAAKSRALVLLVLRQE